MTTHLLALETATEYCSVALLTGGEIIAESVHCKNQHAARLLAMIDALLLKAGISLPQLDAITFGAGPGSFTGVRIAVAVAQGLAYGIHKPVIPLSTLHIMAQQAAQQFGVERALVALDARMQQIYWGCYAQDENGLMRCCGAEAVLAPGDAQIFSADPNWQGVGNGWQYRDLFAPDILSCVSAIHSEIQPDARAALPLALDLFLKGQGIDPAQVIPVYLRDNVAQAK